MFTVWMILIVLLLVMEFIRMELWGACGAVGAVCAMIVMAFGLGPIFQVPVAILVAVLMIVLVRPIGLKYVHRMKKESEVQKLVGADAIVLSTIDNSQGVGIVSINGRQWSARSKRPNAVITAGNVVTVVAISTNTAIVDDRKRNSMKN